MSYFKRYAEFKSVVQIMNGIEDFSKFENMFLSILGSQVETLLVYGHMHTMKINKKEQFVNCVAYPSDNMLKCFEKYKLLLEG